MPCLFSAGIHASRIAFRSAYFDLKKGLFESLMAFPISICAFTKAVAICFINCAYLVQASAFLLLIMRQL